MTRLLALAATMLAIVAPSIAGADIVGKQPGYLREAARSFPNDQAVTPKIWAPGLEAGYAPQGIALVGRHVLVSAYQDADSSRPACRVFRLEAETGAAAGFFDMPAACHHAGGIAYIGGGTVVVADSHQLWRIDLEAALKAGHAEGAVRATVVLGGELGAAFTFFDGRDVWIGIYTVTKDAAKAKIHRLDAAFFDRFDGSTVTEDKVAETLAIPPLCQGAAFDAGGNIWLSASSSQIGRLYRVDRKTGAVLSRYETVAGIEGIDFDPRGRLWAVSEAGARKYQHWKTQFPLIFEIDVANLR